MSISEKQADEDMPWSKVDDSFGKRTMRAIRGKRGFTLVEVLVAMVMLAILSTGIATMMAVIVLHNDFARDMTEATMHGENRIEVFKNTDYASIPSGWDWDEPSPGFYRMWNVKDDTPQAGMKQTTVIVAWFDSKSQFHSVSLETILIP